MRLNCRGFFALFAILSGIALGSKARSADKATEAKFSAESPLYGLVVSRDGKMVVVASEAGIKTFDLKTGLLLAKIAPPMDLASSAAVRGTLATRPIVATPRGRLSLCQDGKSMSYHNLRILHSFSLPVNGESLTKVRSYGNSLEGIVHVGKHTQPYGIVTRGQLYDCRSGPEAEFIGYVKVPLPTVSQNVLKKQSLAIGSGGDLVAIGGNDGHVQIWDAAAKKALPAIEVRTHVRAVAISPDAKTLAVVSFNLDNKLGPQAKLQRFSLPDGKALSEWDTTATKMTFTPDGKSLVVLEPVPEAKDGSLRLTMLDAATGAAGRSFTPTGDKLAYFDITPDGKALVAGGESGIIHHWSTETGKSLRP